MALDRQEFRTPRPFHSGELAARRDRPRPRQITFCSGRFRRLPVPRAVRREGSRIPRQLAPRRRWALCGRPSSGGLNPPTFDTRPSLRICRGLSRRPESTLDPIFPGKQSTWCSIGLAMGRVVPVTECWMVLGGIPAESPSTKAAHLLRSANRSMLAVPRGWRGRHPGSPEQALSHS
jgi:hypothetical protein